MKERERRKEERTLIKSENTITTKVFSNKRCQKSSRRFRQRLTQSAFKMSNADNAFIKFTTTISHLQRRASCHRQGQTFQVGRNFLKFLHYIQHVLLQNSWRTTTSVDTSQRQQTSSPPCPQPGFRLDTRSPSVGPQTPRAMSPSLSLFLSLLSFQRTKKNEVFGPSV